MGCRSAEPLSWACSRAEGAGRILSLAELASGTLWAATLQAGVYRLTPAGKWEVQGGAVGTDSEGARLVVPAAGSASFQLTTPLRAKVTAIRGAPNDFDFQLNLTTSSGETIANIAQDGRRPPEPMLKLVDASGREVAALKFHYG